MTVSLTVQRSIYKDLVLLLQKDVYLKDHQLRAKVFILLVTILFRIVPYTTICKSVKSCFMGLKRPWTTLHSFLQKNNIQVMFKITCSPARTIRWNHKIFPRLVFSSQELYQFDILHYGSSLVIRQVLIFHPKYFSSIQISSDFDQIRYTCIFIGPIWDE